MYPIMCSIISCYMNSCSTLEYIQYDLNITDVIYDHQISSSDYYKLIICFICFISLFSLF